VRRSCGTWVRLPPASNGLRIGLFGGTFNPPHMGHLLVAQTAMRRLKLDRIWWMVTPGNPLKPLHGLPPLAVRMAAARRLARDPRIIITGFEADIGARYTYQTLKYLKSRLPHVHFVWLMGADNLRQFDRWQNWQNIAHMMPVAVIDRPGSTLRCMSSKAAHRLKLCRYAESDAGILPTAKAPALVFIHDRRSELSSTALRQYRV
jgi:nicotinate-nucleotide adenylyltransferase